MCVSASYIFEIHLGRRQGVYQRRQLLLSVDVVVGDSGIGAVVVFGSSYYLMVTALEQFAAFLYPPKKTTTKNNKTYN